MRFQPVVLLLALGTSSTALAQNEIPAAADIENASYDGEALPDGRSALTIKTQVLLDRAGSSPGVIDGYSGGNLEDAIRGFEEMQGFDVDGVMDEEVWTALQEAASSEPIVMSYEITEGDLERIVESNPEDYEEMAEQDWLGFTSAAEALAEKFHMDVDFLEEMNPDAVFEAGQTIQVVDTGEETEASVARIVADKSRSRLLAMDEAGDVVLSYPTSIGSDETPSPSGTMQVEAIAMEPTYSYLPDTNFQQGDNDEPLDIPPGPNGPVGLVWIDLSKPTYGIHGTPYPAEIGKTPSHGCIRLTNWDAAELARMVEPGVGVEFTD